MIGDILLYRFRFYYENLNIKIDNKEKQIIYKYFMIKKLESNLNLAKNINMIEFIKWSIDLYCILSLFKFYWWDIPDNINKILRKANLRYKKKRLRTFLDLCQELNCKLTNIYWFNNSIFDMICN